MCWIHSLNIIHKLINKLVLLQKEEVREFSLKVVIFSAVGCDLFYKIIMGLSINYVTADWAGRVGMCDKLLFFHFNFPFKGDTWGVRNCPMYTILNHILQGGRKF